MLPAAVLERQFPELRHARGDLEFGEAVARAKGMHPRLGDLLPVVAFLPTFIATAVLARHFRPAWMPEWGIVALLLAIACAFAMFMATIGRSAARRRIRAYLLKRGIPLCQVCGYDLRGLTVIEGAALPCPECGHPAEEMVRAAVTAARAEHT